jgi:hypothetical protein
MVWHPKLRPSRGAPGQESSSWAISPLITGVLVRDDCRACIRGLTWLLIRATRITPTPTPAPTPAGSRVVTLPFSGGNYTR